MLFSTFPSEDKWHFPNNGNFMSALAVCYMNGK